jgi:hypothetical protein
MKKEAENERVIISGQSKGVKTGHVIPESAIRRSNGYWDNTECDGQAFWGAEFPFPRLP